MMDYNEAEELNWSLSELHLERAVTIAKRVASKKSINDTIYDHVTIAQLATSVMQCYLHLTKERAEHSEVGLN
jgi:hypothetical protein